MKKYLNSWNKFEIILFSLSIILILGMGSVLDGEPLHTCGVFSSFMQLSYLC